ncbi:MAG: NAD-dependent epimerase/dehydratase family protein, partial [Oscillospiraceae bacterium]
MLSRVFKQDLENITGSPCLSWDAFRGATVLVTGATGQLGGALVHALSAAHGRHGLGMAIMAHGRNAEKGQALAALPGVTFVPGDVRRPFPPGLLPGTLTHVFHCAGITRSADMVARPAEVMDTAFRGTWHVLELARHAQSQSVVNLSSMEVYGAMEKPTATEADLGYLDLSSPRTAYPEGKRMCECLCNAFFAQHGVPVKSARLAQTFGAGTSPQDPRVFAQFARSARSGGPIVLHTQGSSFGNYCYMADAVEALLVLLVKGANGTAYNVANPAAGMTVRDMAQLVATKVAKVPVPVVVDVPPRLAEKGYAADAFARLDTAKIEAL